MAPPKVPKMGKAVLQLTLAGLREAVKLVSRNMQSGVPPTAAEEPARGSQGDVS